MNKKETATKLRLKGFSYNQINKRLNVPKGTLSYWFKNIKKSAEITKNNTTTAKKQWAKNIIAYNKQRSVLARRDWLVRQTDAKIEIKKLSSKELKLVGAALYWAEGYKRGNWSIVFCNSDPSMIKLMLVFFKKVCKVPLNKIKVQTQVHHNISIDGAHSYWKRVTHLGSSYFLRPIFQKNISSKSKRKNNLPYGTLRIKINDVRLVNKIKGWISGLAASF